MLCDRLSKVTTAMLVTLRDARGGRGGWSFEGRMSE